VSQNINLFNPVFLKKQRYFSAKTMAQALFLLLVGVVLFYGYARYQVSRLDQQVVQTTRSLAAVQGQLALLTAERAARQSSKQLENLVARTESQLQDRRRVVEYLRGGDLGNTEGYSAYMRAFARQIISGLWLTGFNIQGAGTEIAIDGRTLRAELVPAYIDRLGKEETLQGKAFANLEMKLPKVEKTGAEAAPLPPYIEFRIQSAGFAKAVE
jgi:hypothetical protein